MLGRLLGKSKQTPGKVAEVALPAGSRNKRAYVLGDIHGRLDLLEALLDKIREDNAGRDRKEALIVFLGDLIDRGPDSRGVIERLKDFPPDFAKCVFIMGNHEEALVKGLNGSPHLLKGWLSHGGVECAESYGLDPCTLHGQSESALEHMLISAIPKSHLEFMEGFYDCVRFGDYLFTHAGVRPNVPIEQQSSKDLKWIRGDFLESDADFGCVVVHGHSINENIVEKHNRIGIDTGAYRTGILTAVRIEDHERSYIQAMGIKN